VKEVGMDYFLFLASSVGDGHFVPLPRRYKIQIMRFLTTKDCAASKREDIRRMLRIFLKNMSTGSKFRLEFSEIAVA